MLERELLAGRQVGDVGDRDGAADPRADPDRVGEAHLVDAVVQLRARRLQREHRAAQPRDQGEREVAVGDGAAEGPRLRALHVDVDPLVVAGRVGEPVDPVLLDRDPLRGPELLADGGGHLVKGGEDAHVSLHRVAGRMEG